MCIDSDLFGDVIVTQADVEFWLDNVPRNLADNPYHRLRYAKQYDVANKIKAAKRSGFYYQLQRDKQNLSNSESLVHLLLQDVDLHQVSKAHRLAHLLPTN